MELETFRLNDIYIVDRHFTRQQVRTAVQGGCLSVFQPPYPCVWALGAHEYIAERMTYRKIILLQVKYSLLAETQ